jgi:hypothetical protein
MVCPLQDADTYEGCTDYAGSHYDEWQRAIKVHPEWAGLEYEEVPRGRVVMRVAAPGAHEYIVYLPPALKKFEKRIARAFNLPLGSTRYDYSDEHYAI